MRSGSIFGLIATNRRRLPPSIRPTGALAGTPGSFTPGGSTIPVNFSDLSSTPAIVASPSTVWFTGQYVMLGDASHAYWSGTAWTVGDAPAVPFTPSMIANAIDWADAGDLAKITQVGQCANSVMGQMGGSWASGGSASPGTGVHTINGRNVFCHGSDDTFTTNGWIGYPHWFDSTTSYTTSSCHYWIICRVTAFDSGGGVAVIMDGTASQRAAFFTSSSPIGNTHMRLYAGTADSDSGVDLGLGLHLLIVNWSGVSSVIYVDNGTAIAVPSNPGITSPTSCRVGQDATGGTGRLSGHTCAWGIGTSPMSSTDRANLRTWAQARWGTP